MTDTGIKEKEGSGPTVQQGGKKDQPKTHVSVGTVARNTCPVVCDVIVIGCFI